MELSNALSKVDKLDEFTIKSFILLLAPITPHLSEELWSKYFDNSISVFDQQWPQYDSSLIVDDEIQIVVQVNGKLRGNIQILLDQPKDDILAMAKSLDNVKKFISEGTLIKEIYVPNKIVNFVVK